MNRKILGGVIALVVVVVGVWFLAFRGGDSTAPTDESGRNGAIGSLGGAPQPVPARNAAVRWSLDADPEGPLRMEGQVLGPDGKGVGGAEVWLASVPARSVKSEDDGTFSFDKLVSRTYSLTAQFELLIGGPVSYKPTAHGDPVIIRLSEGAGVTAIVIDEAHAPISGAEVRIAEAGDRSATTNAKGEATINPVRPGYVAVQASAAGYAPNTGYATVGTAGIIGSITITLHKGYAITGHVIDEAGKPIAKAKVYASGGQWSGDWTPDEAGEEDTRSRHEVVTGDKGEFTIPALASGQHSLTAVDGEHAPGRTPVTIADRPLSGIEITMKSGGTIAGTVFDADHKPVPFVPVRVAGTGNLMWSIGRRQAISDKDGKFELRGLVRAKLQARAESDRAASQVAQVDLTTVGVKRDLELVLDVTGTISGIVVDDKGTPVPEVQVNAFPDIMGGASTEGLALANMSPAITDGAGGFTITGLPDGAYKLWPNRGNSQDWGLQGTAAKTGDKGVRITLASPGLLIGKLVIEGGAAPKLANVQVGYNAPVPTSLGGFAIKDLAPGKYHVVFRGPEFAELASPDVEIKAGKTTDLGTIKVFRGRRLTGKVVDSTGAPVPNAKVKLAEMLFTSSQANDDQAENWEEISGMRSAVTDQDGAFSMIGVPTKSTNAMADSARGRSLAVPIPEGTEDPPPVTLTLKGFGSVTGKVTIKGQPQAGVTISESSKGGGMQASFDQTDDNGVFTLPRVTEGTHVLQAMQTKMMAFKSTTVTVTVTAGRDSKVTIEIPVGTITLAVQIKPLPSAKVDSAQVFLFAGSVVAANAKQLADNFFQGGVQGMKIWLGGGMPAPEFDELVAGDYSVCTVPITGTISDPSFQQQMQENMQSLKVYCRQVHVLPSPNEQKIVHEVPSMDPLPKPAPA